MIQQKSSHFNLNFGSMNYGVLYSPDIGTEFQKYETKKMHKRSHSDQNYSNLENIPSKKVCFEETPVCMYEESNEFEFIAPSEIISEMFAIDSIESIS